MLLSTRLKPSRAATADAFFHLNQHHQPARPLNQGTHRRAVERTFDEIPLLSAPGSAGLQPRAGAHEDSPYPESGPVDPHPLPLGAGCVGLASGTTQQFRSKLTLGHDIKSVINRFVRHPFLRFVRITITECASDLLRRPTITEKILHNAKQHRVRTQLGPSSPLVSPLTGTLSGGRRLIVLPIETPR